MVVVHGSVFLHGLTAVVVVGHCCFFWEGVDGELAEVNGLFSFRG